MPTRSHLRRHKENLQTHRKEQKEYIQVQMNGIRNSIEDRQSEQIVYEVSKRNSISKAKLIAAG